MMDLIMKSLGRYYDEVGMKEVLTKRMLPVLVAARGVISVEMLAKACCDSQRESGDVMGDVKEILPIVKSMFYISGEQLVKPFHTTVLDWLTEEFKVDVEEGKRRLHCLTFSKGK
jgi:hypothetical protein